MAVNVRSVFLGAKYAVPAMAARGGGTIVSTASVSGLNGDPASVVYSASKAAVINLTRSLAVDHARQHIRVNCICPGAIETPPVGRMLADAEARRRSERAHPLGRHRAARGDRRRRGVAVVRRVVVRHRAGDRRRRRTDRAVAPPRHGRPAPGPPARLTDAPRATGTVAAHAVRHHRGDGRRRARRPRAEPPREAQPAVVAHARRDRGRGAVVRRVRRAQGRRRVRARAGRSPPAPTCRRSAPASDGAPASPRDDADSGWRMARAMDELRAVTVAKVQGWCVGGGLVLAGVCDLRVAARSARFSIPEVELGIPLAWGGIPRLVREIGPALTKELVMTCREFGPDEAKAAGFLNRVVDDDALDATVDELVATLRADAEAGAAGDQGAHQRGHRVDGRRPAAAGPTPTACSPGCATTRAGPRRAATSTGCARSGADRGTVRPTFCPHGHPVAVSSESWRRGAARRGASAGVVGVDRAARRRRSRRCGHACRVGAPARRSARRSVSWSGVRGPMIAAVTVGSSRTKPRASCTSDSPASAAIAARASTARRFSAAHRLVLVVEVVALPVGPVVGVAAGALVLAGEPAAVERRPADHADVLVAAQRQDVALDAAGEERVRRLLARRLGHPEGGRRVERVAQLDGRERRRPDGPHLAGGDELAEHLERLADRRVGVRAVQLVEVDVVDAEAAQAVVARLGDPAPRQAAARRGRRPSGCRPSSPARRGRADRAGRRRGSAPTCRRRTCRPCRTA